MKYNCNFVGDLLPLYAEKMANNKTMNIVEEHLEECPECAKKINYMKTDLFKVRNFEDGVKFFKKDIRRNIVSYVTWGLYILVCTLCVIGSVIINILSEHGGFVDETIPPQIIFLYMVLPVCSLVGGIALGTEKSWWKLLAPIGFVLGGCIVLLSADTSYLSDLEEIKSMISMNIFLDGTTSVIGLVIGIIARSVKGLLTK
ncbi:MAG: zf-HC2 domain-containing protein [Lachnospiraceae bacterium]|nr:zf-HC2 domain-containing protein [Lachnospiraceae bacterium]